MRAGRALGLVFLALLVGCATNPLTGESQFILMSPEQEIQLGLQAQKEVEQLYGIVDAPELTAYIAAMGNGIKSVTPDRDKEYVWFLLDQPEPNASAAPGGRIFVSRGLLLITNDEAELAGVLGHEITHVIGRHTANRMAKVASTQLLTLGAAIGVAVAGGDAEAVDAVANLGQGVGALFLSSHSRDHERESDYFGQEFAYRAGFDPTAFGDFFASMERVEILLTGERRMPDWLDTHPAHPERIANAKQRAAELLQGAAPPPRTPPDRFFRLLDGLTVGSSPAEGVFREARFLHPDMDFTIQFPIGWEMENTRSQVMAMSPDENAALILTVQGEGSDPQAAAQKFLRDAEATATGGGPLTIGGLPAYVTRVTGTENQVQLVVDLYFIAHRSNIFLLMGLTGEQLLGTYGGMLTASAMTFRPLTRAERDSIEWNRLRITTAQAGETLEALSRRTGNRWTVEETAVANGLDPGVKLGAGRLVKIMKPEPWPRQP